MLSFHRHHHQPEQGARAPPKMQMQPVISSKRKNTRQLQETPLDAEDLSRRLQFVLAERKAYADKKRRSMANIEKGSKQFSTAEEYRKGRETAPDSARSYNPGPSKPVAMNAPEGQSHYHHVPLVAASQFERTTTAEGVTEKALAHKLSRTAMKFHMEGSKAAQDTTALPKEQAISLQRSRSQREKVYARNQFQYPTTIMESAPTEDDRQNRKAHRHTFDAYFRNPKPTEEWEEDANRRLSTGSTLGRTQANRDSAELPGGMVPLAVQESPENAGNSVNPVAHRVDWTQSDENKPPSRPFSPALRKADSKWNLKARLSFHRTSKGEKDLSPTSDESTSPVLRSPKSGFFARFKR